jgi:hypothetical protein
MTQISQKASDLLRFSKALKQVVRQVLDQRRPIHARCGEKMAGWLWLTAAIQFAGHEWRFGRQVDGQPTADFVIIRGCGFSLTASTNISLKHILHLTRLNVSTILESWKR